MMPFYRALSDTGTETWEQDNREELAHLTSEFLSMTDEGMAYIVVGISMLVALVIPFTIVLVVYRKSAVEVGMKRGKEEKFVTKVLKNTHIFWDAGKKTYAEVQRQDNDLNKPLNVSKYRFEASTDKPDLAGLERYHEHAIEVYDHIKRGNWIPIYKGLQNYEEFVTNQKRYLKSIPKYFWFESRVFRANNIDKLKDQGNYSIDHLESLMMIDAEDILDGHMIRFIDPYCPLLKEQDGDQPIERVKWIWNENDVNVYILQGIYKNTKPMSKWKFDPVVQQGD